MSDTTQTDATPTMVNGMPVTAIRAELDSILKSRVFIHSHRIRRFLQFVVEECLMGQQHRLKEYLIGLEVFNRQEDFDPRVDSIVRVEARRLRMKIDEYYQKEGVHNDMRIELRKGSYVPIFAHRDSGTRDGFPSQAARRHSIVIEGLEATDGEIALASDITRKLAHEVIKGAQFRVLADGNGAAHAGDGNGNGNGNGASKPDYILEGRLERDGHGLQVLLQLRDVDENAYVWSDTGDPDGIGDLAGSLNRAMIASSGRVDGRIRPQSTQLESFDHYVTGRYHWKLGSPDGVRSSASVFEQAVAIDPEYAAAWASLAEAHMMNSLLGLADAVETGPKMREAARQAMTFAPALPEAYVAQGLVECALDCNWEGGERSFQRAIQLDPRDTTARVAYAIQLACRGLQRSALTEAQAALEVDPASLGTHFVLGWLYSNAGRHDEAIAEHSRVSRLSPDYALAYLGLGWAHLRQGLVSEALADFTNAGNLFKGKSLLPGCLGHCYARMNRRDEAMRLLDQNPWPVSVAAIYAGFGDAGRALSALERAAEDGDCSLAAQLLNPEFDLLRGELRFAGLQEKLGLRRPAVRPLADLGMGRSAPASA